MHALQNQGKRGGLPNFEVIRDLRVQCHAAVTINNGFWSGGYNLGLRRFGHYCRKRKRSKNGGKRLTKKSRMRMEEQNLEGER